MGRGNSTLSERPRWDEIIKSPRGYRPRRRVPRRLGRFIFIGAMLILVIALFGAGVFAYAQLKLHGGAEKIPQLSAEEPHGVMNVLLLGSDSRGDLPADQQAKYDPAGVDRSSGRRADTIILLHLDQKAKQVVVVSFPRDLRVTYPNKKVGKINGAYQQGPGVMVDTVEAFTGIPVHHYVEVNFAGFNNLVDAIGGIRVFFERPINDKDSGLNVPKGCVELKGDRALAFVRLRKVDNDFERIRRQQLFVRLMMDKIARPGTILNPVKVFNLVNLVSKNVTRDASLSLSDMKALAFRLRDFNSGNFDMRVVPSSGANIKGVSYVISNQKQSKLLFDAIKNGQPLPDYGRTGVSALEPADVRVTVLNGTAVDKLAKNEADVLKLAGFEIIATGAASPHPKTLVYYKEGNEEKARLLATRYGAEIKPMPTTISVDSETAVVLGKDFGDSKANPTQPTGQKPVPSKGPIIAPPPAKSLVHQC